MSLRKYNNNLKFLEQCSKNFKFTIIRRKWLLVARPCGKYHAEYVPLSYLR